MSYQKNFGGTDGRSNEFNQTNISGFSSVQCPCDVCRIRTVNKAESIAVFNRILSSGGNETNGCNISYGEKPNRELVPQPINSISPQFRNYRDENKEELQQFIVPSSPSISSPPFNSPSQLSAKSNLSFEYCAGPSRTNNDCQGAFNKKIPASSMHFSPQSENQNSKSRYLSHNGSHYQREPTDYDHVDSLQLCDQQSYSISNPSNLPTLPSQFSPRYVANNDIQTQYIPNNLEREVLEEVNIRECGHGESEWFCQECLYLFCYKCKGNHKHNLCRLSEAIEYYGNISKSILQNVSQIDDTIDDALLKIRDEKSKTVKEKLNVIKNDELKTELSKRETTLLNSFEKIKDFKISRLESQFGSNFPDNFMISSFESRLENTNACNFKISNLESQLEDKNAEQEYTSHHDNENICSDLIKEFGLVFGSASGEKTVVSGIALSTIIIDHPCGFIVQSYDLLKNKCFIGGEDIKATLIYPDKRNCIVPIIDLMNGFYQGVVSTNVEGNHRLRISLRGYPISEKEYLLKSKPYISLETVIRNSIPNCLRQTRESWKDMHCDENGRLFITDSTSHKFLIYDHNNKFFKSIGNQGVGNGEFQKPYGITVDKEKRIIVVDSGNHRVQVFSYDGEFLFTFGSIGSDKSHFKFPEGVATNSEGYIAVSDKGNNRIQLFDKDGTFITVTKNNSNSRLIECPHGLCFEEEDTILVSCWGSASVPTTRLIRLKITFCSNEVYFQNEELPPFTNKVIKNHKILFKSKEYYIFTSLNVEGEFSSLYFYNKNKKDLNEVNFEGKTVSSVALSPEGHLYILFLNSNFTSDLYKYTGNSLRTNRF
ncbi:E3 ubiquitin-protein ligase TRIM71 [Armadillidium vulgare]|nr:E3 ubiquitin-protein ligase TRIM71 [Armadillidium vulgare]